jgi:hypothetical protein
LLNPNNALCEFDMRRNPFGQGVPNSLA